MILYLVRLFKFVICFDSKFCSIYLFVIANIYSNLIFADNNNAYQFQSCLKPMTVGYTGSYFLLVTDLFYISMHGLHEFIIKLQFTRFIKQIHFDNLNEFVNDCKILLEIRPTGDIDF